MTGPFGKSGWRAFQFKAYAVRLDTGLANQIGGNSPHALDGKTKRALAAPAFADFAGVPRRVDPKW